MSLCCFSLYLFGLLSLFFLLLDNSNWMRVGELLGGLDIEDGYPPTRKKGSAKFCNRQRRDKDYVWRNFKRTSISNVFKNVAILDWGKNEDFTIQPLPLVNFLLKKEIRLYLKHFGINNVHYIVHYFVH